MGRLWRIRSFRWYWAGLFLSGVGDQFGWLGLSWYLLKKTGSAAAAGGAVLAYQLSAACFGLLAGVFLDRFDRRNLIILDNLVRAFLFFAIVGLLSLRSVPLAALYLEVALAGALSPISSAGAQAMLPRLVNDPGLLQQANALVQGQWQLVMLIGPALAGLCLDWLGESAVLLADAASFLICAACFACLAPQPAVAEGRPRTLTALGADLIAGYRYMAARPSFVLLGVVTFFFNMSYGPLEVALPVLAQTEWSGRGAALGLVWTALGAGALAGSTVFAARVRGLPTGTALAWIIVLWGICTLPIGCFPQPGVAACAAAAAGAVYAPYGILYRSHLQRTVPDELLGRVLTAVRTITGTGMPVGAAVAGALMSWLGGSGMVIASACACLLVGFAVMRPLRVVLDDKPSRSPSLAVEERR